MSIAIVIATLIASIAFFLGVRYVVDAWALRRANDHSLECDKFRWQQELDKAANLDIKE